MLFWGLLFQALEVVAVRQLFFFLWKFNISGLQGLVVEISLITSPQIGYELVKIMKVALVI